MGVAVATALALGYGCYGASSADPNGGAPTTANGGTTQANDLPCEVERLIVSCQGCHGATPRDGAPMALVTRADLTARSTSDPTRTVAEQAAARLRDTKSPMPPRPADEAAEADIAALEGFVANGYPPGTCPNGTGLDVPKSPFDTPVVCTTNQTWTRGDRGSPSMRPGGACIACHSTSSEAPAFSIAGTLYATAHEPNDCNGTRGATVVITDAKGVVTSLPANAVGNFSLAFTTTFAMPYTAKVINGTSERAMAKAQTSGDCNSCHTATGTNDAPGRIMAP